MYKVGLCRITDKYVRPKMICQDFKPRNKRVTDERCEVCKFFKANADSGKLITEETK